VSGNHQGPLAAKPRIFNRPHAGGKRAIHIVMILVITPSVRARDCAQAIQESLREETQVAVNLREALADLRSQEYSGVVLDQAFPDSDPDESEVVLQHIGMAIPIHVNFAISGTERVVREVRAALQRRKKEVLLARKGAQEALRNELKGPLTALLISREMALQVPDLQSAAEAKMRTVYDLVQQVRTKLEIPA
jgi:CheY-like chemotaxis protein